jgi:hypothetical protein
MKLENMLVRFSKPCKYDQSSYGTVCKTIKTMSDTFEIYIQMSKDECYPCWEKVGIFSEKTEHLISEEVNRILNIKQVS